LQVCDASAVLRGLVLEGEAGIEHLDVFLKLSHACLHLRELALQPRDLATALCAALQRQLPLLCLSVDPGGEVTIEVLDAPAVRVAGLELRQGAPARGQQLLAPLARGGATIRHAGLPSLQGVALVPDLPQLAGCVPPTPAGAQGQGGSRRGVRRHLGRLQALLGQGDCGPPAAQLRPQGVQPLPPNPGVPGNFRLQQLGPAA